MTIPAVVPPIAPGTPNSLRPGSRTSQLRGVIDDSGGSGIVIPLNQVDGAYVDWRMQGIDGWDSAELDEHAENKTDADGAWDADNFYGPRIVSINGMFTAPTYEAREVAEEQLRQAVPARRLVQLRIDETIPKYVTGRRTGRVMNKPLTDVISQWSVALLAPDPRKYAVDDQAAAATLGAPGAGVAFPLVLPMVLPGREAGGELFTAVNDGAYETPPLIRIVGPGRDLGIANLTTGQSLSYPLELATGDELVIDTLAGVALLNGSAFRAPAPGSTVTSRFLLPPGTSQMQFLGSRTDVELSPLLTMSWRSAWM